MKKLFALFFIILFATIFPKSSYAQVAGFDTSKQTRTNFSPIDKVPKQIVIPPYTSFYIDPGTFTTTTQIIISEGIWTNMKNLLPRGQSPVASFVFSAYDNNGVQIFPTKPIRVESINNFVGTDTFYYPVKSDGTINSSGVKKSQGQVKIGGGLTKENPGFIMAVNKVMAQDQSVIQPISPSSSQTSPSKTPQNSLITLILLIVGLAVLAIVLLRLLFIYFRNNK